MCFLARDSMQSGVQGVPKSNPLGKIPYLWNCSILYSPILQSLQIRIHFTYLANFIKITIVFNRYNSLNFKVHFYKSRPED